MQTFTPTDYLKIDIASNFGLDKAKWTDRIAWFDANESELMNMVRQADNPALFYAGVQAWQDMQAGEPIGYMISLDATSSGLQLLAALTGDRKAAELCNVLNFGPEAEAERRDGYTVIYERMLNEIDDTAKITRDDTKAAIMTALYGSTAMPKLVFGEGRLLDIFYRTMKEVAPAAWELNEAFLAFWDDTALCNSWVLPDNFHVHVKVMDIVKQTVHFLNEPFDVFTKVNAPIEEGRSLGANSIHSVDGMIVREMTRRCDYDPIRIRELRRQCFDFESFHEHRETEDDNLVITLWDHYKDTGYLSARILDHLNLDNLGHVDAGRILDLINSLPKKPFKVISIHDCFRCHPNYGNDLRIQYNRQLMEIAQSNILSSIISQIIGKKVSIGKMDPEMYLEILDTNYALS